MIGSLDNSGGTERVTTLVANELSHYPYDVYILSLFSEEKSFFLLENKVQVFSLYSKKVNFKKNLIGCILKLRSFIVNNHIDVLVVVDSIACIFTIPALVGLKTKHVCWEHFNFLNNNGSKLRDIARKLAVKYCDIVVTLTKRDKILWSEGLKGIKAKIISIPNPSPFLGSLDAPSLDSKIVLSVGRLTHVKGFDLLLNAWKLVCAKRDDLLLQIVGDGEDRQKLEDLAKELEISSTVQFVGQTDNIQKYYQNSSLLCLSSRNEGLPMVLLEAQAYGLPIVAFDCDTGPAEIIKLNNGRLVEVGDIVDFSNNIIDLFNLTNEKYLDMSCNARNNSKNYSSKAILKIWIEEIFL